MKWDAVERIPTRRFYATKLAAKPPTPSAGACAAWATARRKSPSRRANSKSSASASRSFAASLPFRNPNSAFRIQQRLRTPNSALRIWSNGFTTRPPASNTASPCRSARGWVAQATRLCGPATRRTKWVRTPQPTRTAVCAKPPLSFRSACLPNRRASRQPEQASRPRHSIFKPALGRCVNPESGNSNLEIRQICKGKGVKLTRSFTAG